MTKIGILALQGAFAEHEQVLNGTWGWNGSNQKSTGLGSAR